MAQFGSINLAPEARFNTPTVFISYAWEDDRHKAWVADLCKRLMTDDVQIVLDIWNTAPGDQLPEFMETAIRGSDFVLFICTPKYRRKSDLREGGVGFEGHIISAESFVHGNHRKFIPILRGPDWTTSAPSWALGKRYLDFRNDPYSEEEYLTLCSTLKRPSTGAVTP
jgi:TIR domain-containing protein